ncbi:hypothetical protein [Streptomyces sp. NPDC056227]|uniref:hypothetical protein n=1 Tax=Streptomyces sp. NPDC056227 TaxID=3345753 RepID=UPI0035D6688A
MVKTVVTAVAFVSAHRLGADELRGQELGGQVTGSSSSGQHADEIAHVLRSAPHQKLRVSVATLGHPPSRLYSTGV